MTYKLLSESVVIPEGKLKRAEAPVPFAQPAMPGVPAKSVTLPAVSIFRIQWLEWSTTYIFLLVSKVMEEGLLNWARVPIAFE